MRQQDSRTRERICAVLKTPGNAYSRIFEALGSLLHVEEEEEKAGSAVMNQDTTAVTEGVEKEGTETSAVAAIIMMMDAPHPMMSCPPSTAMMTAATTRKRMEVWWKYNLQTECFSHKAIARHVRRCGL
jgi:hypothetical protein